MGSQGKPDDFASKPISLAIIGGGLAGLALTIGLLPYSQHINTTIYEAAAEFAEVGVGVAFGPNAVRAMGLISPDILKGFKKHATGNENAERQNTWLSFRYGMESRNGNGKKYGDLIAHLEGGNLGEVLEKEGITTRSCIHRARFLEELAALVPEGAAKFGKKLMEVEDLQGGGVALRFTDGEEVVVDAVVGCDGVKSMTRPLVLGSDVVPKFTGEYAYRALVPSHIARETLGDELALNGQLYVGYGGYIITYPVEHGKFINIAATRQKRDLNWDEENWIISSTKEDMAEDYKGWGHNIIELISRFEFRDKWAFFDLPHSQMYYRGRLCLVGDSAHASTPHLGAGAGMAFEDAYILSNLLGTVKDSGEVENAFRCFDAVRRGRSQNVIMASRKSGKANCFEGEGIRDNLEMLEPDIEARYRWVWDFDLEATLMKAKKMLLQSPK